MVNILIYVTFEQGKYFVLCKVLGESLKKNFQKKHKVSNPHYFHAKHTIGVARIVYSTLISTHTNRSISFTLLNGGLLSVVASPVCELYQVFPIWPYYHFQLSINQNGICE